MNEDGTLTEAGRQSYMYDIGSGKKMSLVGRIKFGKEASQIAETKERERFEKTSHFVKDLDTRSAQMQAKMKDLKE